MSSERTNSDATVPISKLALPSSRNRQSKTFLFCSRDSSARYSGNSQPNKLSGLMHALYVAANYCTVKGRDSALSLLPDC